MINIKKVAYGLKNCTTLIDDDRTFHHPELMGTPVYEATTCCESAPKASTCGCEQSPADIVASYEKKQSCVGSCGASVEQSITSHDELKAAANGFTDDENLANLVRQLISSMNK